jgi:hypothetical protein
MNVDNGQSNLIQRLNSQCFCISLDQQTLRHAEFADGPCPASLLSGSRRIGAAICAGGKLRVQYRRHVSPGMGFGRAGSAAAPHPEANTPYADKRNLVLLSS